MGNVRVQLHQDPFGAHINIQDFTKEVLGYNIPLRPLEEAESLEEALGTLSILCRVAQVTVQGKRQDIRDERATVAARGELNEVEDGVQ